MALTESYLFLAFGRNYIFDCFDFIETKKILGDKRPVDIVVSPEDYSFAISLNSFNNVLSYDVKNDILFDFCSTKFEKYCLLPRLNLFNFLNTQHTIVLDTDILYSFSADKVWDFCKSKKQNILMLGSKNNPLWHWGKWGEICSKIGIKPQETHGGFFFLKKEDNLKKIFEDAKFCFLNYSKLGMLNFYQNGAVDEPCFSYAFSKNFLEPIEFSEFPIMTFNLKGYDEIPTKKMTETMQSCIMSDYIPFIHMFEKNKGRNFLQIKDKILKNEKS